MSTAYSPRLDLALSFVADRFRDRYRKGTRIPYLTHLLQVMVTTAEYGGDEDQLLAALLHDYLEDIPGAAEAELRARFGDRVARLVLALSDATDAEHKGPWEARKRRYLAHLARAPEEVRLVSAADKLHNARSIRRDLALVGPAVWDRFSVPRDRTLWYYRSVARALAAGWDHPLARALEAEVRALHRDAGVDWDAVADDVAEELREAGA